MTDGSYVETQNTQEALIIALARTKPIFEAHGLMATREG